MPQKRYRPEEIIARLACQPGRDEALHRTGSPWENGHVESFNGKLRDELLNGGPFYGVKEAQSLTQKWRREYNRLRPHSSFGGRPPAPETMVWPDFSLKDFAPPALTREPALALS